MSNRSNKNFFNIFAEFPFLDTHSFYYIYYILILPIFKQWFEIRQ